MDKLPGARFMNLCTRVAHKIKPEFQTLTDLLTLYQILVYDGICLGEILRMTARKFYSIFLT